MSLDFDKKGYVTIDDFLAGVPNMANHAMAIHVMESVTVYEDSYLPEEAKYDDSVRVVDFQDFVRALDEFSSKNQ